MPVTLRQRALNHACQNNARRDAVGEKRGCRASAARHGNAYAVRTQVQEGADPDARGRDGVNLLQFAILSGSRAGFEALLDSGADPEAEGFNGTTALHTAALADDPSYLELMLGQGADPNARNRRNGETPGG